LGGSKFAVTVQFQMQLTVHDFQRLLNQVMALSPPKAVYFSTPDTHLVWAGTRKKKKRFVYILVIFSSVGCDKLLEINIIVVLYLQPVLVYRKDLEPGCKDL